MACPWFPLYTNLLTPKFVICDIFLILVYIWIKNREEFDMTGVMIYLDQGDPIAMMSAAAGRSEHRPTNATAANATLGRWCSASWLPWQVAIADDFCQQINRSQFP